jgi:hypothetical protein
MPGMVNIYEIDESCCILIFSIGLKTGLQLASIRKIATKVAGVPFP